MKTNTNMAEALWTPPVLDLSVDSLRGLESMESKMDRPRLLYCL